MTEIIGVRFQKSGRMMFYDPKGEVVELKDQVLVNTDRGIEHGTVTIDNINCDIEQFPAEVSPIIRLVTKEDQEIIDENERLAEEALDYCIQKVHENNLPMKMLSSEYTFDRAILLFYFTANKRVDFRKLVRDLAQNFHTRIELRQIGIRDQARALGGLGPCGQEICCRRFMKHFMPVSIKMAKTQGLSLNPSKISGLCGRLMCCLNYEQEHYLANTKKVPREGTLILSEDGQGYVLDRDVLQKRVRARIYKPDGTEDEKYYNVDEIEILEKRRKGHPRPDLWTNLDDHVFVTEGEKKARRRQEQEKEENSEDSGEDEDEADQRQDKPGQEKEAKQQAADSSQEKDSEEKEQETAAKDFKDIESPDHSYEEPYGLKGRAKPRGRRRRRRPKKRK